MNNIYNLRSIFHKLIITLFLLSFSGCGVKKAPYYKDEAAYADENVKFLLKKSNADLKDAGESNQTTEVKK